MKRAALALLLVACGSRHEAVKIELHRGGAVIDHLALPLDLWTLCGRDGVTAVVARGSTGFVRGDCARRGDLRLDARVVDGVAVAELTRGAAGTLVARATGLTEIAIPSTTADVAPASLRIEIEGADAIELAAERVDALAPAQHPRDGAPLAAILAAAGVDLARVTQIAVRSDGARIELTPGALTAAGETVSLRRNRRGTLRFTHTVAGTERDHLPDVIAIEVSLEP